VPGQLGQATNVGGGGWSDAEAHLVEDRRAPARSKADLHPGVRAQACHADAETTMQRYTDARLLDSGATVRRWPLPGGTTREVLTAAARVESLPPALVTSLALEVNRAVASHARDAVRP
jgi:hypothetical protein